MKKTGLFKIIVNKLVMPNSNVTVKVIFTNSPLVNISISFAVIAISVFAFFQYKYFKTKDMNLYVQEIELFSLCVLKHYSL